MARSRSSERGVGELVAVIVLAVLGLAWTAFEATRRSEQIEYERARAAGAVFASWMHAVHRRAQEAEPVFRSALALEPGVAIAQSDLVTDGFAPEWLTRRTILGQSINLGVVDDGGGVPMAFAVASPSRPLSHSSAEGFRAGAAAGGVVGIESLGTELGAETFAGLRRSGMEHALGRSLTDDDLVSVADSGVVYDERVVYRRQQPGREYLSEMRTNLTFAPAAGIRDGGVVHARTVNPTATFVVGRLAHVSGDAKAGNVGGEATFNGELVHGKNAAILALVQTPRWRIGGVLKAGRAQANRELRASRVNAASLLDSASVLAVDDDVEVSRTLNGHAVSAGVVSGADSGGSSGTIRAAARLDAAYGVADELEVLGNVEVTERCYGCAPNGV